tara:strand:- start:1226 stop:1435 length:210 start_codon:yes stop_codon:yes gene_type:complete
MKAEDKAKELIQLFYNKQCSHSITELAYKSAKQCALICVDEIVKNTLQVSQVLDYWQEVKQEIENIKNK